MTSSSSSSSSIVTASLNVSSLEKTISDLAVAMELLLGHTVEFGTLRISWAVCKKCSVLVILGTVWGTL
jgi:hypothetical protein